MFPRNATAILCAVERRCRSKPSLARLRYVNFSNCCRDTYSCHLDARKAACQLHSDETKRRTSSSPWLLELFISCTCSDPDTPRYVSFTRDILRSLVAYIRVTFYFPFDFLPTRGTRRMLGALPPRRSSTINSDKTVPRV